MNNVSITGRLTRDPELRYTQNSTPVTSFSVAVDRPGVKDKVDFIDCVAWRASAEFVSKYFKKGSPIEVKGIITARNYEDRDGNKRKAVEVVCDRVSFAPQTKRQDGEGSNSEGAYGEPPAGDYDNQGFTELGEDDGDLPF